MAPSGFLRCEAAVVVEDREEHEALGQPEPLARTAARGDGRSTGVVTLTTGTGETADSAGGHVVGPRPHLVEVLERAEPPRRGRLDTSHHHRPIEWRPEKKSGPIRSANDVEAVGVHADQVDGVAGLTVARRGARELVEHGWRQRHGRDPHPLRLQRVRHAADDLADAHHRPEVAGQVHPERGAASQVLRDPRRLALEHPQPQREQRHRDPERQQQPARRGRSPRPPWARWGR